MTDPRMRSVWLGWPLPIAFLLVPACLIVGADLATTWASLSWDYGLWWRASSAWHESLLVVGPIATAGAALYAGVLHRGVASLFRRGRYIRHGRRRSGIHLGVTIAWYGVAHALGMTPLMLRTAVTATGGTFDPVAAITGLAGLAAFATLGYGAGLLLRSPGWTPLLAAGVAVWCLLPLLADRAFAVTGPVQWWALDAWTVRNPPVVAYGLAFLAALGLLGWGLITRRLEGGTVAHVILPAVLTICLVAGAFVWRPMTAVRTQGEQTCRQAGSTAAPVQVCLHVADRNRLDMVAQAVDAAQAVGAEPLFTRVVDAAVLDPRRTDEVGVAPNPYSTAPGLADQIVSSAASLDQCAVGAGGTLDEAGGIQMSIVQRLRAALDAGGSAVRPPAGLDPTSAEGRVWAMPDAAFRRFVSAHVQGIRTCSIRAIA